LNTTVASSADHTINTLRYADRIKERTVGSQAAAAKNNPAAAAVVVPRAKEERVAKEERASGLPTPPARIAPSSARKTAPEAKGDELQEGSNDDDDDDDVDEFHRTIESVFEEEEALLNLHMNVIQENAELLTEEGRLLQQVQNDDNDMDAYAARLDEILARKQTLITILRAKLATFRECLRKEESVSSKVKKLSVY
jgi:kinesin family protein 2/24